MTPSTNWSQVGLIIAAGVVAAAQIGKAAIAAPLLRADLGLSLVAVSWIVGAYAAIAAVGGITAGMLVSRFAIHKVLAAALALIALGNFIGASAHGFPLLLASRIVEGVGFLGLVVSATSALRNVTAPSQRNVVFAVWASYIPVGSAIMLLAGPWLASSGWQTMWIINGTFAAVQAVLLIAFPPPPASGEAAPMRLNLRDALAMLKKPWPRLLAVAFMLYALQYYALANLLPALLVEHKGASLELAGAAGGIAVVANALGNVAAGFVLTLGAPLWAITAGVFLAVAITSFGMFSASASLVVVVVFATGGLALTALLPASIIATAPRLAGSAAALALVMGIIQQASAIGQVSGPVVLAAWMDHLGWSWVPVLFGVLAAAGLIVAWRLRSAVPKG